MPEQLLDVSKAKQFLANRNPHWSMWYSVVNASADELWVDEPSHISSLMVVKNSDRRPYHDIDADIDIETDLRTGIFDLLSALDISKNYYVSLRRKWMWRIFEAELNAEFTGERYEYGILRGDFTPQIRHRVRELSVDDAAFIDTIPDESDRDLTHRQFKMHTKSFVVVEGEQLVSYACAHGGDSKEREIDWIYTHPDKRRRGYGASVASTAAEYMFQTGAEKVTATVDWYNHGSIGLWEKLGGRIEESDSSYILRGSVIERVT